MLSRANQESDIITNVPAAHILGFVRSGYIAISNGRLWTAGTVGYDWPSTAGTYSDSITATAYFISFSATDARPSNGPDHRWYGYPLRCLAD